MKLSILIAEDDALLRNLLSDVLAREEDFKVVGCVGTGREALDILAEVSPDVLLLDLHLPELSGLEVMDLVFGLTDAPRILVLSGDEGETTQLDAARQGAQGFVGKTAAVRVLVEAIRTVAAGGVWFSTQLITHLLREHTSLLRRQRSESEPAGVLSPRQRDILALVARGMTNQQIADDLGMSLGTVKVHLSNILKRLNLPNRTEAAVFALREGLVLPGEASSRSTVGTPG